MSLDNSPPAPTDPKAEPKRKRRWVVPTVVGVLTFAAGAAIGGAGEGTTPSATAEPEAVTETIAVEVPGEIPADQLAALDQRAAELDQREADVAAREAAVTTTEQEIAAGTIPGDGIFLVGTDIQPGQYRTQEGSCYWARLSGTSGELDDIIANGNGAAVVTVAEGDAAFEVRSCGEWTAVQ